MRNWLINLLSPSWRLVNVKPLTEVERKMLYSGDYAEFRLVLFKALALKANENNQLLIRGQYRTDRECGNLQGSIRTIADMVEMFTPASIKTEAEGYEDIMNHVMKDADLETKKE